MDSRQVIQCFRGKPVRFFRATFETEINPQSESVSRQKLKIQTYAVPLIDLCNATGCDKALVMRHFEALKETYHGLFTNETLPDTTGKSQPSILMAYEMVIGVASSLITSRINDLSRARVIDFQRWVLQIISLIRRRKLQFFTNPYNVFKNAPAVYIEMLQMVSGAHLSRKVTIQAETEGITREQIYRRLHQMRGGNVITTKGVPRKMRGGVNLSN
jgi:hypothetical protein